MDSQSANIGPHAATAALIAVSTAWPLVPPSHSMTTNLPTRIPHGKPPWATSARTTTGRKLFSASPLLPNAASQPLNELLEMPFSPQKVAMFVPLPRHSPPSLFLVPPNMLHLISPWWFSGYPLFYPE
jgi:hypothetical protein